MTNPPAKLRVVKKLAPGQPGTVKLARRYGSELLCVRYRLDDNGQRLTTVELVVDRNPVVRRSSRIVGVRVRWDESSLQSTVKAGGARWDKAAKLWRMPYRVALALGLKQRVVEDA